MARIAVTAGLDPDRPTRNNAKLLTAEHCSRRLMPGMDADPGCAYQAWQHGIRCKFFSNLQDHLWALDWAGRLASRFQHVDRVLG